MSPENRMLEEVRFEMHGHQIVAYLPPARQGSHEAGGAPPGPTRWVIKIDETLEFPGPVYRGFMRHEAGAAEVELRQFLAMDPRFGGGKIG